MCLAEGHNAVTPVRLEPAASRSHVKHSNTEPLRSRGIDDEELVFTNFTSQAFVFAYGNKKKVFMNIIMLDDAIGTKVSRKGGKDQKWIQSSTTPDPGYHMGKF